MTVHIKQTPYYLVKDPNSNWVLNAGNDMMFIAQVKFPDTDSIPYKKIGPTYKFESVTKDGIQLLIKTKAFSLNINEPIDFIYDN